MLLSNPISMQLLTGINKIF